LQDSFTLRFSNQQGIESILKPIVVQTMKTHLRLLQKHLRKNPPYFLNLDALGKIIYNNNY